MHNCALRLLPSPPTSFTTLLQAAAARAWVRTTTISAHNRNTEYNNSGTKERSTSLSSRSKSELLPLSQNPPAVTNSLPISAAWERHENSVCSFHQNCNAIAPQLVSPHAAHRLGLRPRPSVTYFQVENVDESDFERVDPGRSFTCHDSQMTHADRPWYKNHTSFVGVPTGKPLQTCPVPLIPVATTPTSLYRNLLYILSHRSGLPSLAALLDYHDLHPSLRSARSYNLLIWLALRHCCFGTVQWLLAAMRADGLEGNLETWKLKVRWLVQAGSWDRAWNEVSSNQAFKATSSHLSGNLAIPLPIWLEFFRGLKRGALSGRMKGRWDGSYPSLLDFDPKGVHSARFRTLMANPPSSAFHESTGTSPRTVYFVVLMMLKTRYTATALSLTKSYFHSLPPRISTAWVRTCLDIIHLHIIMGSSQKGLKKLYEVQRTMSTLITLHPTFRPSSTTLFLLLAPLRQAKRCGTVAWNVLHRFRSRWGTRVEDRRVRRRVAALATKEGRMDIVNSILLTERIWNRMHGNWKTAEQVLGRVSTVPQARQLLRARAKRLFKHNGREERQWCLLQRRIKRRVGQLQASREGCNQ